MFLVFRLYVSTGRAIALSPMLAGKCRRGCFLHFHSCSSFIPIPLFILFYYLFYLFSSFLWEMTQNDPQVLTCRLTPTQSSKSFSLLLMCWKLLDERQTVYTLIRCSRMLYLINVCIIYSGLSVSIVVPLSISTKTTSGLDTFPLKFYPCHAE